MLTLHTKDGTKYGNAIIICQIGDSRDWPSETRTKDIIPVWLVESDFGNRMRLTDREIDELYHRGERCLYADWSQTRFDLITRPRIPTPERS